MITTSELKLGTPFNETFTHGEIKVVSSERSVVTLYPNNGRKPWVLDKRRYDESVRKNKILTKTEFGSYLKNESSKQAALDGNKEPKPLGYDVRLAGHHWLDDYDMDGHFFGRVVLQWNPGVERWSHSGNVATGMYVDTTYWRYVCPCPIPE